MAVEQMRSQDSARPDDPAAGDPVQAILTASGLEPVIYDRPHPLSYGEWFDRGLRAHSLGMRLEEDEGELTPAALAAYREAGVSMNAAVWEAPIDQPADPLRMMVIADSLAKQSMAETVEPYSEPQRDEHGNLIDRRQNLARISNELAEEARRLMEAEDPAERTAEVKDRSVDEPADSGEHQGELIELRPEAVSRTAELAISKLLGGSHAALEEPRELVAA